MQKDVMIQERNFINNENIMSAPDETPRGPTVTDIQRQLLSVLDGVGVFPESSALFSVFPGGALKQLLEGGLIRKRPSTENERSGFDNPSVAFVYEITEAGRVALQNPED